MNLPNKLTLLRVLLIPFFLLFMYLNIPFHFAIALVIFGIASITDALDGRIARSRNLVTNFGKFLDPLADKVLVIAALAVFVEFAEVNMSAIPFIIITAREFMVSGRSGTSLNPHFSAARTVSTSTEPLQSFG